MIFNQRMIRQLIGSIAILSVALIISFYLIQNKNEVVKDVQIHRPPLVEVFQAESVPEQVIVESYGIVQCDKKISIYPEVSGVVVEQSPNFSVGGLVVEGEVLLQIDPRDYLTALEQEKASLKRAEFELKQELGRCHVANKEWSLLSLTSELSEISEVGKELALRVPQLQEKQAALEAAKSRLERAAINLERTAIKAPFNAIVTQANVDVGQLVFLQMPLATLVGTDEFNIQVNVPYNQLKWLNIPPYSSESASRVKVIQDIGKGQIIEKDGVIKRLLADVDPNGRMARVLVTVADPFRLKEKSSNSQLLLIGSFVRVNLMGSLLNDVFVIPRNAFRNGDQLWVCDCDNRLKILDVEVVIKNAESVVVSSGITAQDQIILSVLPFAYPGMELRKS